MVVDFQMAFIDLNWIRMANACANIKDKQRKSHGENQIMSKIKGKYLLAF